MRLDERKIRILQAIIDDFISTAEPVGSRTIARKYNLGVSSATIRNEMSDLEEMGYLEQPHTSAGRIPSDKAYRFYVDRLMKVKSLKKEETENIKQLYRNKISQIEQVICNTAKILSDITNYTSIVLAPQMNSIVIKHIQLVPIDNRLALLVIVTNAGILKDTVVKIPEDIDADYLNRISNILNKLYKNKSFGQVNLDDLAGVRKEFARNSSLLDTLIDALSDNYSKADKDIYYGGTTNIFNFPEYQDVVRAKSFLNLLEEKELLYKLLSNVESDGVTVSIGTENPYEELRECSIVSATYKIGDRVLGSIGIIGPTRMEYSKAISAMDYMAKTLSYYLTSLYGK